MKLSEDIKNEIIERLLPIEPERVFLFGSYAWGNPSEESDIDIFLIKDMPKEETMTYSLRARKQLRPFIAKNLIGVDIFSDSEERMRARIEEYGDYFYKDILTKGVCIYE